MLIAGGENLEKIKILISLAHIKSNEMNNALIGYYCLGVRVKIDKSNFKRYRKKLESVNDKVNQLKELDNE